MSRPVCTHAAAILGAVGFALPVPAGSGEDHAGLDAPFQIARTRRMEVPAGRGGHFFVEARVKRRPPSYSLVDVDFLVDTGASRVVLTAGDGERAGFKASKLDYSVTVSTANGVMQVAPVVLPEIRIGKLRMQEVEAYVSSRDDGISLLGNSFLGRLAGYQIRGDRLVLEW